MRRGLLTFLLCLAVTGCATGTVMPAANMPAANMPAAVTPQAALNLAEQAAVEATAIVQQAQATALVMQARAQATALIQEAAQPNAAAGETQMVVPPTPPPSPVETPATPAAGAGEDIDQDAYLIELVNVGYAAEGGFLIVNFHATTKAANDLWPGTISVTDETSGVVYDEVPNMPVIGPLIGRPKAFDQAGYAMLVNTAPGLPATALVTVRLGTFTKEHVAVTP